MAEAVLKAKARARGGKGAARSLRREGLVPGVIYGDKTTPDTIVLPYKELWMQYQTGKFLTTLVTLDVDGKQTRVIPRDVQVDPVRDHVIHVDFQRVPAQGTIRVAIPVRVINQDKSPGLKRGGALNLVRHEVELHCPPDNIPDHLDVDMTGLEIGASVHISHVALPAGTSPVIKSRDFTVVTVAGAVGDRSEAAAEATPAAAAAPAAAAKPAAGAAAKPAAGGAAKPAAGGAAKPAAAPAAKKK